MTKLSVKHKYRMMVNSKNIGIARRNADILIFYLGGSYGDVSCLIVFYFLYFLKYYFAFSIYNKNQVFPKGDKSYEHKKMKKVNQLKVPENKILENYLSYKMFFSFHLNPGIKPGRSNHSIPRYLPRRNINIGLHEDFTHKCEQQLNLW